MIGKWIIKAVNVQGHFPELRKSQVSWLKEVLIKKHIPIGQFSDSIQCIELFHHCMTRYLWKILEQLVILRYIVKQIILTENNTRKMSWLRCTAWISCKWVDVDAEFFFISCSKWRTHVLISEWLSVQWCAGQKSGQGGWVLTSVEYHCVPCTETAVTCCHKLSGST